MEKFHPFFQQVENSLDTLHSKTPGVNYLLSQERISPTELQVNLKVQNTSQTALTVKQRFSEVKLKGTHSSMSYLFPSRNPQVSSALQMLRANYGAIMNSAFMAVYDPVLQGIMVIVDDALGSYKLFKLHKTTETEILISVNYQERVLQPGEEWKMPSIIFKSFDSGLLHSAQLYKQWFLANRAVLKEPKDLGFRKMGLMRVIELHEQYWYEQHKRAHHTTDLVRLVKADQQILGKLSFVHLWDWSYQAISKSASRVGNYLSSKFMESQYTEALRRGISQLKDEVQCEVGLYIQGYLVDKSVQQSVERELPDLQMLDGQGKPYNNWGDNTWTMCPCYKPWQQLLSLSLERCASRLATIGFYIDQFGFGMNTSSYKICSNPVHKHNNFDLQIGERELLAAIRNQLPQHILYAQEIPNDSTITLLDGSLSTGAKLSVRLNRPVPILLTRFLFPWFKVIELITEYNMCERDLTGRGKQVIHNLSELKLMIKVAMWNGNGLYVPKNLNCYDQSILQLVKEFNTLFKQFEGFLTGQSAQPLIHFNVEYQQNQLLVNQFPNQGESLYTVLNWSDRILAGSVEGHNIQLGPKELAFIFHGQFTKVLK